MTGPHDETGAGSAEIGVRPARPEDEPFLREAYASTRAAELELVPWSDAQKRAFCDLQFDAQIADYCRNYRETEDLVVFQHTTPIGRILKALTVNQLILLDFMLLPPYRNQGWGSVLLRRMQDEARASRVPMVLTVKRNSPAMNLYRRHGFVITGEDDMHYAMKWMHVSHIDGTVPPQKNTNHKP